MDIFESIKKAETEFAIHPLIASRWSPRAYDPKPVENEKLQRIFEAARWAASSGNIQPWYFLVGYRGDEVYAKIFGTLVEFDRLWAGNSPILALGMANTTSPRQEMNMHSEYDLGQAMALLSIQATNEGIYIHQMGGFDTAEASRLFKITEDYKVVVAFTIGYRGDAETLPSKLLKLEQSPRLRRTVGESVFTGYFGQKADFL